MDRNNTSYCFYFTESALKANAAITISLHLVAVAACALTVVFIFATKQHYQFANRLILYLTVVSSLWSVTIIAQVIPVVHDKERMNVEVRPGWKNTCASIGFIAQVVESSKILVVCWIVLYLLLLVIFKYKISNRRHEMVGLVTVVALPPFIDWIPFSSSKYGLSGLWCWIKLTDNECNAIFEGILMMLAVEYISVFLAVMFTLVSFVCVVITFFRRAYRIEMKLKWTSVYQQGLSDATVLMVYPTLYAFIFIFRFIHRTIYIIQIRKTEPPSYMLWLSHSATLGICGILVPFLFILRPSNLKKVYFCRKFIFKSKDHTLDTVFRSNSVISTEVYTESENFTANDYISENNGNSSNFYGRSIFQ